MSIVNTPTLIDIPLRKLENVMASKSKTHLKHGKPIGSKDIIPKKKKKNYKQHMKSLVLLKSLQI